MEMHLEMSSRNGGHFVQGEMSEPVDISPLVVVNLSKIIAKYQK